MQRFCLHDRRQYALFFFFFKRQVSLELPFLLMSSHAEAFRGGNVCLCRRRLRQPVTEAAPMKSDT